MNRWFRRWVAVLKSMFNLALNGLPRIRSVGLIFLLCFFSIPYLYADTYSEAAEAFDQSDFQTAYDLLYPLAESGEAKAQYELGILHFQGWRVPGEYRTAHAWISKSAEQGYAEAQEKLGNLYRIGMVVPQDDIQAYAWFSLAAAKGNKAAATQKRGLAKTMTSSQLAEAEILIIETEREIQNRLNQ